MVTASDPVVSVLMPVYNGERFLESAVRSVLTQSYEPFELVVVDDGSTDGSSALLARLAAEDVRIRVHHQENRGHAGALNTALEFARGEFVAVLDCDDEALPGRLEAQVDALERDRMLVAIGGAAEFIREDGACFFVQAYPTTSEQVSSDLLTTCPVLHSAMMMRRDAVMDIGAYRETLSLALDYDILLRLDERAGISNLDRPVVRYRIHAAQTTTTRAEQVALSFILAQRSAMARRRGAVDPVPPTGATLTDLRRDLLVDDRELDYHVVRACVWYAKLAARSGRRNDARQLFSFAEQRAARSGQAELIDHVSTGRARVGMRRPTERLRASLTRPLRRAIGRS